MTTDAGATIADLAVDALHRCGIDTLFCLPGVQNDDFFDRLFDHPSIQPIVTRHEQGAAYMAMGASQATGRPAACCVVPGPGMLNATGALTSAYWGGARVFALVGAVPTAVTGKMVGVLHDLPDPTAILAQVTKHAVSLTDPAMATGELQQAIDELVSDGPRPVSVEVPVDNWTKSAPGVLREPVASRPQIDADAIEQAAVALAAAARPLIVVGSGAFDASEEVTRLAELLQAPVTTRRMGHGVMDARHELFAPLPVGHGLWAEADVVVGIGTRMEWPLMEWGVDDRLTVIQINIDPREVDRHGLGTIGVVGDAAMATSALLESLEGRVGSRESRTEEMRERRAGFHRRLAGLEPQRRWLRQIREVLPDDGVFVEDVTQMGFAAHLDFEFRHPRTFLASGAAGTLGAGVGVGIGAQQALPDRQVLTVVGDGGFLFTASELATAVQHDIPATFVLFNNNAYGNVKLLQQTRFGADRTIASTLRNPDFVAMAESFGVRAERLGESDDLRPALERGFEHDGPALIEVQHGELPSPWPHLLLGPAR